MVTPGNEEEITRPSHRTLFKKLEWEDEPGVATVIGEEEAVSETYFLDSFWLSIDATDENEGVHVADSIRSGELGIMREVEKLESVRSAGAKPFFKTLYYCTSSEEDLKDENVMRVDFPLLGGYISFNTEMTEDEVYSEYEKARESLEKNLEEKTETNIDVIWGHAQDTTQHPNIFYMAREDDIIVAEDKYPSRIYPHSIYFDYSDIVTKPIEERRKPQKELSFGMTTGDLEVSTKIKDVSLVFDKVVSKESKLEMERVTEIPLSEFRMKPRISYALQIKKEVGET
ncbi:MAG: hypothetical protein U5J64_02740 [Halobacteriales archaeon]|nr:hypothetical protein [Halobacteriales archaeon]